MTSPRASSGRLKVVRVIARLNVGGPAIQAITLTSRLGARGYDTVLVRGQEGAREGSMDGLVAAEGITPVGIPALRRELGFHDLRALGQVLRLLSRARPDILHTHAAKGGTIGRVAALALGGRGPRVTVHTFHGHVLEGYFSPLKASLFTRIERWLARRTSRLIAVSEQVRNDLVRLGIGSPATISVIPLGFELERFLSDDAQREASRDAWRRGLAVPARQPVVLMIARLVPIKRVDRFLRIAARVAAKSDAAFVILGDGELRDSLRASAEARALGDRLHWLGFHADVAPALFGSDVVVQTSDNEGTPVSLIEAHAAGLPAVSTDVGGVTAVVRHGVSGYVAPAEGEREMAEQVLDLLGDPDRRARFGLAGRAHVTSTFTLSRLMDDLDGLYRELLDVSLSRG